MDPTTKVKLDDVLQFKKPHPCGSRLWRVLRIGADFRLKCTGCGRTIMLPRADALKRTVALLTEDEAAD